MINVMLDLETWGTKPGCDIRSIGAVVFDPATGHVASPDHAYLDTPGTFYLATDNPTGYWGGRFRTLWTPRPQGGLKYRLTRDSNTVQWWREQSEEAQAAFTDPVELPEALSRFTTWLAGVTRAERMQLNDENGAVPNVANYSGLRLWAHGAAFDAPILTAAYEVCERPLPWHYRSLRDTRTLFDAAGIDDHSAWLNQHPGPLGVPHHALDDAICQARAVCATYDKLRSWETWMESEA